jgi:chromosome segregation ATPase
MSQTEKPRKPASRSKAPNLKLRVKTQEERHLELRVETQKVELEELREKVGLLEERNRTQETTIRSLTKGNESLTEENGKLRGLIHSGELAYAKLMGYVERIRDEQPPLMVPQQRESFLASAPDGTLGYDMSRHAASSYDFDRQRPKRWFER